MNNASKNTKDVAEEHNKAKFDKIRNEKYTQLLMNAVEINKEESVWDN